MSEVKKGETDSITFKNEQIRKYFPKAYTTEQMEETLIKLLEQWQRKRERKRKDKNRILITLMQQANSGIGKFLMS